MKVAFVHDWLVTYAGAEKVLEQMVACFPDADIFSVVDFLDNRDFINNKRATTTFIQKLPFAKKKYRGYLPLMPFAIEQLDLSGYDVIVSSSHAVAKGVLTGPDQIHISYVHSPIRYAWDLQHQYLRESKLTHGFKSWAARLILHYVRVWDSRTAMGVDQFLCNSEFIRRRILKTYRRDARVIYPPVDLEAFNVVSLKEDFYLTASRMVPYKKIDLIAETFSSMPNRKLVIIGDGPDMEKVKAKAGPNVTVLGYQSFAVLKDHMQRAKAFVFAAEEDFGITPVEAQACGTPVVAFGRGGAVETVVHIGTPGATGVLFSEQSMSSMRTAIELFESNQALFTPENCRAQAERFSTESFRRDFTEVVEAAGVSLVGKRFVGV